MANSRNATVRAKWDKRQYTLIEDDDVVNLVPFQDSPLAVVYDTLIFFRTQLSRSLLQHPLTLGSWDSLLLLMYLEAP